MTPPSHEAVQHETVAHSDPGWQTAKGCDGPGLHAWFERMGVVHQLNLVENFARRLWDYKAGSVADFYTVDRMLTHLGMHPQDVPEQLWLDRNRTRRGDRVSAEHRQRLAQRAQAKKERKCAA